MLVVCILASALGALVMCLLVLRYGFIPILETNPAHADRDLLVTRLGHAAAGVCFAASAILAVVYIARAPAQPASATPDPRVLARLAALERERQALGEQVGAVGGNVGGMRARLDQAESRVAGVEVGLKRLGADVAQSSARARQLERVAASLPAPVREPVVRPATRAPQRSVSTPEPERPSESASPPAEPVAPGPMTHAAPPARMAAAAAPKPAPAPKPAEPQSLAAPNLGDKVRTDWDKIRRGFSTAGDEIMSAIRGFGRP